MKCPYPLPLLRILFLFLAIGTAHGQSSSLTVYLLSESNGLTDNRVTCVLQDHHGFMWIGTENGLNRFDGSAFRTYKRRNHDSTGLADNLIHAMAEDHQHHLWIATQNGLSEFDPLTNSFTSTTCRLPVKGINMMQDVTVDQNDHVWIGTFGGLLEYIPSRKVFVPHINLTHKITDNKLNRVLVDRKNRIWLAAYSGLWRFHPERESFELLTFGKDRSESAGLINTVVEDRQGKLWLGYWNRGLNGFDPETGLTDSLNHAGLPSNVEGIAFMQNATGGDDLWFSNLLKLDSHGQVTPYALRINPHLDNYHISKLYASRDGLLWICSNKGVLIMDPSKQFFKHFYFPQQITHQGMSFLQREKEVHVGGSGPHFLDVFDSTFHRLKSIPPAHELQINPSTALLTMVPEDNRRLWLCTESGLIFLDEKTGTQHLFRLSETECPVPTRNFINTLFIDSHTIHWVFPWRAGIWQLNPERKKFSRKLEGMMNENGKIKGLVISATVEDSMGNLWFADLDEGLIHFDRQADTFSKPTEKELTSQYTLSNVLYEKPYIWGIATGNVFRIHEKTHVLERWPIPEELDKPVTGFCFDHLHQIWITTRSGLLSFDPTSHLFKQFTIDDGLNDNMMTGTLYCLTNGNIIYGDENYVTVFDPLQLRKSAPAAQVFISQATAPNQLIQYNPGQTDPKLLELDYSLNNFTIEWTLQHYSNPFQNRYYCKLEGVDADWKFVGNSGKAQYAGLSSGKYVFRVKAAPSEGVILEPGDATLIIIHPPFWRTWWFAALLASGFFGLTYLTYRYNLAHALKTEKLRNQISTDLHDEIGSALSSISIMSNLVIQKTKEPKTTEVATEIRDNTIVLMERMDDIVWSINPRNDSLENLLLRLKRFAAQLFEAKNIDYEIDIRQQLHNVKLSMESRQHIYLILKEAINNIVKHSQCTQARIRVDLASRHLDILISDNGTGFDQRSMRNGNGLSGMAHRAESMKMKLQISSETGQGTTIELSVTLD